MARELTPEQLDELLGAYALDALPHDERDQVERYLDQSPRARAEVVELRETAALLAHAGNDAPPGLWDRIAGSLPAAPGRPAPVPLRPPAARRRWTLAVAAAVAAAIAIAVLGVQVVRQDERLRELEANAPGDGVLVAAEAARRDPDARTVALRSADGLLEAELVHLPDGNGFLLDDNLAPLPAGRVYQLWALAGEQGSPRAISAGVLGRNPQVSAFRFAGPVMGFLVTEEEAPGVVSTTNRPLLRGTYPD